MGIDRKRDERIAQRFHEVYEQLAPQFGYETRAETRVPWDQVSVGEQKFDDRKSSDELIEEGQYVD